MQKNIRFFKRYFWILLILLGGLFFIKKSHLNYLINYVRSDFKAKSNFFDTIKANKEDVILGFNELPDFILVAKKFKEGYYLVQQNPNNSILIPKGINLLENENVVLFNVKFDQSQLKNAESGSQGNDHPANFPFDELKEMGYNANDDGEWVLAGSNQLHIPKKIEGVVNAHLPDKINFTDWSKFNDLQLPDGFLNVGGWGFPVYADEEIQNGKINLFAKGFTNAINIEGLPRNYWDGKNTYYFNQLYYLVKMGARLMVDTDKVKPTHGDIGAIASLEDYDTDIPYYKITIEGAKELGRHIYYATCCANSIDDQRHNISKEEGVIMIDEESMTVYNWEGGSSYEFFGYLTEGIMEVAGPKFNVLWYAQPISTWPYKYMDNRPLRTLTTAEVKLGFHEKNIKMKSPGWNKYAWFVNANGSYAKVPFLSNTEIYEKENGEFVLDKHGKRKFRNEDFSILIYGKEIPVLSRPHEFIRYALINENNGQGLFGREYVDIHPDGSASIKKQYEDEGYRWHYSSGRPYPQFWQPETELWVDGIYRRADGIMMDLLMLAKLEKGKYDISKANTKYKLYGEHRPQTEPWTPGGNSIDVREVGESQIFYDTFMLLFSGGLSLSSWDDGFYRYDLPKKGEPMYDHDDYYGRYHSKLAAVQTVFKPLEGSKPTDWTYIHFYYPFWGSKNSEVISSGIYYKDKFYTFFLNPTLENGEKQTLKLQFGDLDTEIDLIGHEVYYKVYDVPQGLNPNDFKLSYTTIYDRKVRVNGVVTDRLKDHYEKGK